LRLNGNLIETFTLSSTSPQNYGASATVSSSDTIRIVFINDGGPPDRGATVDYITVDGTTYQAENQAINTGAGIAVLTGLRMEMAPAVERKAIIFLATAILNFQWEQLLRYLTISTLALEVTGPSSLGTAERWSAQARKLPPSPPAMPMLTGMLILLITINFPRRL